MMSLKVGIQGNPSNLRLNSTYLKNCSQCYLRQHGWRIKRSKDEDSYPSSALSPCGKIRYVHRRILKKISEIFYNPLLPPHPRLCLLLLKEFAVRTRLVHICIPSTHRTHLVKMKQMWEQWGPWQVRGGSRWWMSCFPGNVITVVFIGWSFSGMMDFGYHLGLLDCKSQRRRS